jgi:hypothetical protein
VTEQIGLFREPVAAQPESFGAPAKMNGHTLSGSSGRLCQVDGAQTTFVDQA